MTACGNRLSKAGGTKTYKKLAEINFTFFLHKKQRTSALGLARWLENPNDFTNEDIDLEIHLSLLLMVPKI